MTKLELAAYRTNTYSAAGEHLFAKYPSFQVVCHDVNRKWFAVIMDIPRKKLKLPGEGEISVDIFVHQRRLPRRGEALAHIFLL